VSYVGERFIPKRFNRQNIEFNLKYIGKREEHDILETVRSGFLDILITIL